MRKGINQWSFPDSLSLEQCFALASSAGFEGVELVLGAPVGESGSSARGAAEHLGSPLRYLGFHPYQNDAFSTASTPDEVRTIRARAEEAGLRIPSVATVLPFLYPPSASDAALREEGAAALRKALEFAGLLGAETLLVVPGVVTPGERYDEAVERSRSTLRSLLPVAEEHGVVMGIENVWNQMLLSPIEFRDFVASLGSPWAKAYVDVGNLVRTGFGEQWLEILDEQVDKIHFCNFRAEVGNLTGFTRHLLDGDVDWPAVTRAMRRIGYDGWVTAEVTPPAPHYPDKVIRDLASTMDWILAEGPPSGART